MKSLVLSIFLFFIFYLSNGTNDLLASYEFSKKAIAIANIVGFFCLLASFILAFSFAIMWKNDRETKAFILIFVGLAFGFLTPDVLLPLFENINPAIMFFVDTLKNIALFSSAGCAGSLFAISAELYSTDKKNTPQACQCECESSRKETIKLSGQLSKLTTLIYIAFALQFVLVVGLIAI